jgi:hypothetical protein
VQECPQPPPGPMSHAGGAGTGAPTDRSRSLAIGRAVRGSRPDQCVDHCPCLPVFFSWLHFRQPRQQEPHVAAHSSDHRIGSGLRPRDRGPFVGARHPLRPHFARSSSAGHRWPAARDTSWPTLITSSGRHIMRRSVRQAPSAASTRPPRRTADLARGACQGIVTPGDRWRLQPVRIAGSEHIRTGAPRVRALPDQPVPRVVGPAVCGLAPAAGSDDQGVEGGVPPGDGLGTAWAVGGGAAGCRTANMCP